MPGETSRRGERGVVSGEVQKKVIWGGFQGRVDSGRRAEGRGA